MSNKIEPFFCLNRVERSRLAFERVLELEPQNVHALIALAILDMNNLDAEGIQNGVQSLGRAYQIDQENPVVLNHLANHFFYRNVRTSLIIVFLCFVELNEYLKSWSEHQKEASASNYKRSIYFWIL